MNINPLQVKELQKTGKEILVHLFVKYGFKIHEPLIIKKTETLLINSFPGKKETEKKFDLYNDQIRFQNIEIIRLDMEVNFIPRNDILKTYSKRLVNLRTDYKHIAGKYSWCVNLEDKKDLFIIQGHGEFIKLLSDYISQLKPSK